MLDRQRYPARIAAAWRNAVEGIVETGRILIEAKAALAHGAFGKMIESELPFSSRTARKLMAIAAHPVLSKRSNWSVLPASWTTLYMLSQIPAAELGGMIDAGIVTADMTGEKLKPAKAAPVPQHDEHMFTFRAWFHAAELARVSAPRPPWTPLVAPEPGELGDDEAPAQTIEAEVAEVEVAKKAPPAESKDQEYRPTPAELWDDLWSALDKIDDQGGALDELVDVLYKLSSEFDKLSDDLAAAELLASDTITALNAVDEHKDAIAARDETITELRAALDASEARAKALEGEAARWKSDFEALQRGEAMKLSIAALAIRKDAFAKAKLRRETETIADAPTVEAM